MTKGVENEDDLLQGIYQGAIKPTLEPNLRKSFKPWHKPRKHFVRLNQWCHETRELLKILNYPADSELRYLGLPGEDLLDIRVLKGVCQEAKVKLRYLGFDSSLSSARVNLSRHEVNSDQFIHSSSLILSDRVGDICSSDSFAFRYFKQHAPFDVINLDFCNSVTKIANEGEIPNLEAIRMLCDKQIRGQPWLMFLTTRAIRGSLDRQTRERLFGQLLQNIGGSNNFSEATKKKLQLSEDCIREEIRTNKSLNERGWLSAYVLAISKWLLHYMMANGYTTTVRMLRSYTYSVQPGCRDMVSLAFFFEPVAPTRQDRTGLTRPRAESATPSEPEMACSIIDQIAAMEDVDEKLKNDKKLRHRIFLKSASLLGTLRYDIKEYRKFALTD